MKFHACALDGAWLLDIEPRGDDRGFFARTMCQDEFSKHGLTTTFVQQNLSVSPAAGTLRGLHFQYGPYSEAKLVRCTRGALMDVIVDLRANSPTYLQHELIELTAESRRQVYLPAGFAHGFQTLTDDTEISYLVSAPYTPSAERGVHYADPVLGIPWPVPVSTISEKDAGWAPLDPEAPFDFSEV